MPTPETPDLLPCPFCGGAPRVTSRAASEGDRSDTGEIWFIACFCGGYAAHAHQYAYSRESAAAAWNTRSPASGAPVGEGAAPRDPITAVQAGIDDARHGRVKSRGSFAQYVDDATPSTPASGETPEGPCARCGGLRREHRPGYSCSRCEFAARSASPSGVPGLDVEATVRDSAPLTAEEMQLLASSVEAIVRTTGVQFDSRMIDGLRASATALPGLVSGAGAEDTERARKEWLIANPGMLVSPPPTGRWYIISRAPAVQLQSGPHATADEAIDAARHPSPTSTDGGASASTPTTEPAANG